MTSNLQIIVPNDSGTTYDIYDDKARLITLNGRGIPNTIRRLQKSPGIDGAFDKGFILEPRRIDIRLFYDAGNAAAADAKRDELYKIFRPVDAPMKLKVTRSDSAVRQIDCFLEGILDVPDSELYGQNGQAFNVRLVAPDPIWYDPTEQSEEVTLNGETSGGWGNLSTIYDGNWFEYPIIRLYGEITNPGIVFTNFDYPVSPTLQYFISTPSGDQTIPDGEYWEFDFRRGQLTVTDDSSVNQISNIDPGSDIAEFRLWPCDIYSCALGVTASAAMGANAKVEMIYYNRYIGI